MDKNLNISEKFYETGEIHFRYSRIISNDGAYWIRHGLFCEYHQNGMVISHGNYFNGKEHRPWRDLYPDGKVAAEGCYENGIEVGVWHYWDAAGNQVDAQGEQI